MSTAGQAGRLSHDGQDRRDACPTEWQSPCRTGLPSWPPLARMCLRRRERLRLAIHGFAGHIRRLNGRGNPSPPVFQLRRLRAPRVPLAGVFDQRRQEAEAQANPSEPEPGGRRRTSGDGIWGARSRRGRGGAGQAGRLSHTRQAEACPTTTAASGCAAWHARRRGSRARRPSRPAAGGCRG